MFKPTKDQEEVLNIKEGIHLVLAPPGSGKTELLAKRVEQAIHNHGFKDEEIICLTFTTRAAKGMRDRIEKIYPNHKIIIGNIHHYCSTFLFKNKLLPLNTSVIDEEDCDNIIEELKNQYNYHPIGNNGKSTIYNPNLLRLATYIKQKNLGFSETILLKPKEADIPQYDRALEVCKAYLELKETFGFIDFDDLLTLTYDLLRKKKNIYELSSFKWIQVDEVQDLNSMQWAVIEIISTKDSLVVYFGDYEQAIFSFMGAKLESLHHIESICKADPKNRIHNFQKNFRSPSYLLNIYIDFAKGLLNPLWKKDPISNIVQPAPTNSLKIYSVNGTIFEEARFIVKSILSDLSSNPEDKTAIIVRYNKTADIISSELNKHQISHFKISGFDVFRRKTIKGLMSFFD